MSDLYRPKILCKHDYRWVYHFVDSNRSQTTFDHILSNIQAASVWVSLTAVRCSDNCVSVSTVTALSATHLVAPVNGKLASSNPPLRWDQGFPIPNLTRTASRVLWILARADVARTRTNGGFSNLSAPQLHVRLVPRKVRSWETQIF